MSTETYSLVLNSQNTTNVINSTSRNAYQYYVKWANILPIQYAKYNVTFSFLSSLDVMDGVQAISSGLIGVNFGGGNNYDQTGGLSTIIGKFSQIIIYQVVNIPNSQFFSNYQDNPPVTINYPSNNIITVTINDINLANVSVIPHYYLKLCFTPIPNIPAIDNDPSILRPTYTN